MERPFATLKFKEIKRDYPKSVKDVTDWLSKTSIEGQPITEDILAAFFYANPLFLRDYFDDKGIYIAVIPPKENDDRWVFYISGQQESFTAENRRQAEEKALMLAFDSLEKTL